MLLNQDHLAQVRMELQQTLVVQDQLAHVRMELQQTLIKQAKDKADLLLVLMELVETTTEGECSSICRGSAPATAGGFVEK
jgi:hypothetical protein